MDILSDIKASYPTLSNTQMRIAIYITSNPETACFLSLKELAETLHITQVTIVSFVKKLGYKSFVDFKKELQAHIRKWLSPNDRVKQAVSGISDEHNVIEKVIAKETESLQQTFAAISPAEIHKAALLLRNAKNIFIIGHGISEPIALFTEQRLQQLGIMVELLDILDLDLMAYWLDKADKDSVFIVISFPVYYKGTVAVTNYLVSKGIKHIAISDRFSSPIAENADVALVCNNDDAIFYNSITAAISLVNLICSVLALEIRDCFDQYQKDILHILSCIKSEHVTNFV